MEQTQQTATSGHSCRVERFYDRSRQVRDETQQLARALQDAYAEIESTVREQFTYHPYTTFGVAFGVGYILGGGLPSRFTRLVFELGTRIAVGKMVQQFTGALVPSNDGGAHAAMSAQPATGSATF